LKSLGKLSVNGINEMKEFPSGSPQSGESNLNSSEYNDAKRSLLRSKGFMWLASSSNAAYFMSHAGQYLEIAPLGRWWAGCSTIILF
jgi:G3E family GTPase